jgi:mRNA-degrading endonuclease RelE of RelBE toxin-antitoxin system
MSYRLVTVPASRKALKKLPRTVRENLIQALQILCENPVAGESLQGEYGFLWSFHYRYQTIEYRVVYEVLERQQEIVIRHAATRENFYKQLKEMKLKPL